MWFVQHRRCQRCQLSAPLLKTHILKTKSWESRFLKIHFLKTKALWIKLPKADFQKRKIIQRYTVQYSREMQRKQ